MKTKIPEKVTVLTHNLHYIVIKFLEEYNKNINDEGMDCKAPASSDSLRKILSSLFAGGRLSSPSAMSGLAAQPDEANVRCKADWRRLVDDAGCTSNFQLAEIQGARCPESSLKS
jgi:hypothetical protein